MEKSGVLVLTEPDVEAYEQGRVSQRVKESWGLTYDELHDIIQNKRFEVVKLNQNSTICRYEGNSTNDQ